MYFKITLLIILLFSSMYFSGCGRKDAPLKPSQISSTN